MNIYTITSMPEDASDIEDLVWYICFESLLAAQTYVETTILNTRRRNHDFSYFEPFGWETINDLWFLDNAVDDGITYYIAETNLRGK